MSSIFPTPAEYGQAPRFAAMSSRLEMSVSKDARLLAELKRAYPHQRALILLAMGMEFLELGEELLVDCRRL